MSTVRLTESRIEGLKPRPSPYDVRDGALKGFGVRVLPSGAKRYFIHSQHEGRRVWKTVGAVGGLGLDEARRRATELLAAIRRDEAPVLPEERLFETVAEEVFDRYGRRWKPRTLKVNRDYLRSTILPRFAGMNIADIAREDVQRWFASLHATPVAADRSAPILSVIMRQAEVYGYRPEGSNPCAGIRRYRRKGRERFLSGPELRRLGQILDRHEGVHPRKAAFVRLLLLTGCRKTEIATLQWSDYREGGCSCATARPGPGRSGCPRPPAPCWTVCRARANGSFPRRSGGPRRVRPCSTSSGAGSGRRRGLPMSGFTIAVTPTPASPSWAARASRLRRGCSGTTMRRRRSDTPTFPTARSGRPPTRLPAFSGAERCRTAGD